MITKYYQIYLKASEKILKERDFKGGYNNQKNIVGVDIKFPEPFQSDLIIENNTKDNLSPQEIVDVIYNKCYFQEHPC